MRTTLHFIVVLALTGTAHAGLDCEESATIKSIEAFAKRKQATPGEYDFLCLQMASAKLKPRVEKACTTILDRDGIENNPCVITAAAYGFTARDKGVARTCKEAIAAIQKRIGG